MSRRWVWGAAIAYVLIAAVVMLGPFKYSEAVVAIWAWLRDELGLSGFGPGWIEFIANVALFVPLGVVLSLILRRPVLGLVLAIGVSIAVELAQLLLPGRVPSMRDVLANALGAAVGGAIAWLVLRGRARATSVRATEAPDPSA